MPEGRIRGKNGRTNQTGLTSRTSHEGSKVTRAATTIEALIAASPATAVAETLNTVALPDMSVKCAFPGCQNDVTWTCRGRPRHFCSDAHRAAFSRDRRNLERDLDAYERLIKECHANQVQTYQLNIRITAVRRLLSQYRNLA